jgi:tRNA wybutosine-synthesizing protein 3
MSFETEKQQFLKKPDKSLAGEIDPAILGLVSKINKNPDYYTTSSCAGRIILMPETGRKQEKIFLLVSHNPIDIRKIKSNIISARKKLPIVYLKHEPCIMHAACRTLEKASKLVGIARNSGWKKSGIISIKKERVMCELNSNEILAAPIADKGKLIASENYLKILVKEANKKLDMTRQKIKKLEKNFK